MTRIGSLCSGAGALDLAVEQHYGGDVVWHCENDPAASKVLAARWPGVPNLGDLTAVDWAAVEPVDVLTAGYPCQPFSLAGRRAGTDDARHLWSYIADALGVMRPPITVFENVRGHLSLGFDQVMRDLNLLGYDCRWMMLRAADVGAPHGRARVFIIGRDRHERWLRSRIGGRGGVHRDRQSGRVPQSAAQGVDDRQRAAVHEGDGAGVWREDIVRAKDRQGSEPSGCLYLASERLLGGVGDSPARTVPAGEGRAGADRAGVRGHAGGSRAVSAAWGSVDATDARQGGSVHCSDSGSESAGTRSANASAAGGAHPVCGVPLGRVVGADRRPVWASVLGRKVSDERADDFRALLRASDIGAPHRRFRVLIVATSADAASVGHERGWRAWDGRPGPAHSHRPTADADIPGPQGREPEARRHMSTRCTPTDTDCNALREQPVGEPGRGGAAEPGQPVQWGQYEPAIRRWERVLGRAAPAPTEPATRGGRRLAPALSEWMQGLPAGWVCDVPGLTRNDQLRILGNGCVPQQVQYALRLLLGAHNASLSAMLPNHEQARA